MQRAKIRHSKTSVLEVVKLQGVVFHELNMTMRSSRIVMHLRGGEVLGFLCEKRGFSCLDMIPKQVVAQGVLSGILVLQHLRKLDFRCP